MFSDSTTRQVDRRYFGNRSTFSGSIAVIYVALSFALFGLLSLRDTFSQSEERQYIAFAALVGNVGEQLVLLTTVNGERARFFLQTVWTSKVRYPPLEINSLLPRAQRYPLTYTQLPQRL